MVSPLRVFYCSPLVSVRLRFTVRLSLRALNNLLQLSKPPVNPAEHLSLSPASSPSSSGLTVTHVEVHSSAVLLVSLETNMERR